MPPYFSLFTWEVNCAISDTTWWQLLIKADISLFLIFKTEEWLIAVSQVAISEMLYQECSNSLMSDTPILSFSFSNGKENKKISRDSATIQTLNPAITEVPTLLTDIYRANC